MMDEKQFWSPQIKIGNNMVWKNKEEQEFGLMKNFLLTKLGIKKFYLSTTVKCDMDFQTFPFDRHVCNLEVS